MYKLFLCKHSVDSVAEDACLQGPFEKSRPLEASVSAEPLQTAIAHHGIQAIIEAHTASLAAYLAFKTHIDEQVVVKSVNRCQEYADWHKHQARHRNLALRGCLNLFQKDDARHKH